MDLTEEQINKLIKEYKDRLFQKYDKPIPYGQYDGKFDPKWEAGLEYQWLEHHRQKYQHQRIAGDYSEIEQVADKLLVDAGIQVEKTIPEYTHFCHGLLKAESEGIERYQNNLDGKPTEVPAAQSIVAPVPEQSSITLEELAKTLEQEKSDEWSISSKNDWQTIKKQFFHFVDSSTIISAFTKQKAYGYRDLLKTLPVRALITKKYKNITQKQFQALDLPKEQRISIPTINKHLTFLSGLFKVAVDRTDIPINPFAAIQIKEDKRTKNKQKVAEFSPEDLKKIYHSPTLGKLHPYRFWIPILGLFTGARREELCSLYREDIRQEEGVWYISINMDTPDKSIKTYQDRNVPLHPFILELGFLDYVNQFKEAEELIYSNFQFKENRAMGLFDEFQ